MVVLLLVVVWLVALVPIALRKFTEWQVSSSVADFRYRIRAMGRACPAPLAYGEAGHRVEPSAVDPTEQVRRHRRDHERARLRIVRRRRTLAALLATLGGTFVLGAIPALRGLWDISLAAFLLTTAYIALLVRFQRALAEAAAATERAEKVVPIRPRLDEDHGASVPYYGPARSGTLPPARPAFVLVDVRA